MIEGLAVGSLFAAEEVCYLQRIRAAEDAPAVLNVLVGNENAEVAEIFTCTEEENMRGLGIFTLRCRLAVGPSLHLPDRRKRKVRVLIARSERIDVRVLRKAARF